MNWRGERRVQNGIAFWQPSRQLPSWLQLLVTRRAGGRSRPPYDSLNLGLSVGDCPDDVRSNRRALGQAFDLDPEAFHLVHQVHGRQVVSTVEAKPELEADGLWTRRPHEVLAVGVADCVPLFLWDAKSRVLSLLHAGWRGTAAGILSHSIALHLSQGSRPQDLHLVMGPSIGPCCYEIGHEVEAALPQAVQNSHLDLRLANRQQALRAGLAPTHIGEDPPCTACHTQDFFSHRRLGPRTGRMWAVAWLTATAQESTTLPY